MTYSKHTRVLYSPPSVPLSNVSELPLPPFSHRVKEPWFPTPKAFWESDSQDDNFEDYIAPQLPPAPITAQQIHPGDNSDPGSSSDSDSDLEQDGDIPQNLDGEQESDFESQVDDFESLTPPIVSPSNSLVDFHNPIGDNKPNDTS